jgi:hypothetical protein
VASELRLQIGTPATLRTQVSTGTMLGGGRTSDAFYVSVDGGAWEKTYSQSPSLSAAQGRLMNMRTVMAAWRNAAGDTEDMSEADAEANTDLFLASLEDYWEAGVHALTVGCQGGNPVVSDVNISQAGFTYDGYHATEGVGSPSGTCSLFNSDGTLKSTWQGRLERIIEAMDQLGMVCNLNVFYQRQCEVLATEADVQAAMSNLVDWLIDREYRNITVDLVNEMGAPEWDQNLTTDQLFDTDAGTAGLIADFIALWDGQPWRPPTGASFWADDALDRRPLVGAASDVVFIHGNGWTTAEDGTVAAGFVSDYTVPIVMDEDDNEASGPSATSITNELASLNNVFDAGASHGAMLAKMCQRYDSATGPSAPFRYAPRATTDTTTGTYREKWGGHCRAYLDEMETLTGGLPPGGLA